MKTRLITRFAPFFGLLLFAIALVVLYHELSVYHLHDILGNIKQIHSYRLFLALLLTVMSYLIMTGYDTLALCYVHHPLSYGRIVFASFIGYAFSNNIGLAMIAGGSVRYRLYSAWGLSTFEITKVVAFCSMTLWLGFFTLGGGVFLLEPLLIPEAFHLPFVSARPLGAIFLAFVFGYLCLSLLRKKPLNIQNWEFSLPSTRLLISQMAIASLDWGLAGSVLYVLMAPFYNLSFPSFLGVYLLAQLAGLASQLPGGLGVFETVVVLLLSPAVPASQVLGSLVVYRGIFYILPLLIAAFLLGSQELFKKKETFKNLAQFFGNWLSEIIPVFFSFTTFVGGAILLFSGVMPAVAWRIVWIEKILPLPIIELSHFLGSLIGVMLILLARSIQRRVDAAYLFTIALLGLGILFSLLKGFDYEEAIVLSFMLLALLPCRRYFYRKGSFTSERFRPGWVAAITLVLLCSTWLGFFSFKHVEYSSDLWWHFTLFGDAPRFLRAMVGVVGVITIFITGRLLRSFHPKPLPSGQMDLGRIVPIVQASNKSYSNLALLGGKSFLFSQKRNAFIMYGMEGRSWIGMGDPIGPEEEWPELIWRFREMCDRYDGWTVFYEVGSEKLHLYLDLGLTLLKLGEEGRVFLESFSLEGSSRKKLRYTSHKLEKEGCVFEMIPQREIPTMLPEFKEISDVWLEGKNTREKGFSLGFFQEDYLKRFPAGVVRKEGKLLGFTNVLMGGDKKELSSDLMRYRPEAPPNLMEYLFTQLMLWGKKEGYQWLNLGMAPLSGLEDHELSPLRNRLGAFVFHHGEHFYNLQGLRQYKEKFDPIWEPKYLISPGGFSLPHIIVNIASLISGGIKGVISK
ncbi:bifunctional lysylphosphatidylglycerol flippase/synthetase MprF [Thermodesulfobacteriota bacterium]